MTRQIPIPQVGVPDPEQRTSPLFDAEVDEELSLDIELETGFGYFNDARYALGQYVRSGHELLQCAGRGIWIRKAE